MNRSPFLPRFILHPSTFILPMGCSSNGKTPASHAGDRGSIPRRSTAHGPMVQREDTSSACWRSGFDPRWVHSKRKAAG